jgi:metallo-beta-lactamase family protein
MKLTFYGGTGEATGANYILESAAAPDGAVTQVMVDCGLHQGSHVADRENFEPFPYDASKVAAVFVTHSHLDHIGRLPSLVRAGFVGKIYSTGATKDFAELMLIDSEHLLMKEAEREGKMPLYNNDDIAHVRHLWEGLRYHEPVVSRPVYDRTVRRGTHSRFGDCKNNVHRKRSGDRRARHKDDRLLR